LVGDVGFEGFGFEGGVWGEVAEGGHFGLIYLVMTCLLDDMLKQDCKDVH
jgi:hypothetical protein